MAIGTLRDESRKVFDEVLRHRLRELAGMHVRYGYRRLTVLLRREGWHVNAKRIYRLYREEELIVRTKNDGRWRDYGPYQAAPRRDRTSVGVWIL